jgi:hypothetical protein
MAKTKTEPAVEAVTVPVTDLATALATAIETARPKKITISNRKKNNPWMPKDGSPKLKLKRRFFQHGLEVTEKFSSNEEIDLMNKVKPGTYCDGFVRVTKRRDKGINIDYSVKTASQRLKLINDFGIRSFAELLRYVVDEAAKPKRDPNDED